MEANENQENNRIMMRRNPQQRQTLYRNLLNKIERIEETEDVGLGTTKEIGEVLKEANSLDEEWNIDDRRVEHADETFLDCLVLSSASSVLKKCVESVDVFTSTYNSNEFSNHIVNCIKDDNSGEIIPSDLLKLLDDARKTIPELPDYTYMYGSYDLDKLPQPKPKKERLKSQKEKLQKTQPEKVTSMSKEEEAIEDIVKVLHQVLTQKYNENNERPIKYYDYIIDTDDFANTVENMFYFSFLIRDGKASIDLDNKGQPIILPSKKRVLKEFRDEGGVNAQIVTQLNAEHWKRFQKPGYLQQHRKNSTQ